MRNIFNQLRAWCVVNLEFNFPGGRTDDRNPYTSLGPGAERAARLCLLLDRTHEANDVRPHVLAIRESPARAGVLFLCGSMEDALVDFAERLRQVEMPSWLNGEDGEPTIRVSPPSTVPPQPVEIVAPTAGGLLTAWAHDHFGEMFRDDTAVPSILRSCRIFRRHARRNLEVAKASLSGRAPGALAPAVRGGVALRERVVRRSPAGRRGGMRESR